VVIIGAGPAGLTAGFELIKRAGEKYNITIIEKESQVGGIAKTVAADGFLMDLGGHRYFSLNEQVVDWWKSALPDGELLRVSRSSKILYQGRFIDYPINLGFNTVAGVGLLRGIRILLSYIKAQLDRKDESTLEGFYRNRFGDELYRMFFRDYTEKVWGQPPVNISSEWGYQRVRSVSVANVLKNALHGKKIQKRDVSLTDYFYYPRYGSGYLWQHAADRFCSDGGRIMLSEQISNIKLHQSRVVEIQCASGYKLYPDYVISSMPIRDLIESLSAVPEHVLRTACGLEYRSMIVVGMLVQKKYLAGTPFYDAKTGLIQDQWLYIQDAGLKAGRIQILDNWSPDLHSPLDGCVCIELEYFCQEHDENWNFPDEKWVKLALHEVKSVLGKGEAIHCMSSKVVRVEKAYPCYWGSYRHMPEMREYINSIENLICIGRNGQHRYHNIDHAMITGQNAAKAIIGECCQQDVWNVNTERIYHECNKKQR
jgi:protoporphyrinogen oxidase